MLVSEDISLRDFAVGKILAIRDGASSGDSSNRPYHMPDINVEASDLRDLIEWSNPNVKLHEPLLTCQLTQTELISLIERKMNVPEFPVHGQNIERCVQSVTRASESVCGKSARDGFIKATLHHRKLLSTNESKKDLMALFD